MKVVSIFKKGIRCLGIAESFSQKLWNRSILAGVVMRSDLIIDGAAFTTIEVGGLDSTEGIIRLFKKLKRKDINFLLINGTIIALYNVIDLNAIYEELRIPLVSVTYEESRGIEDNLRKLPLAERRLEIYKRNGGREEVVLKTGYKIFVRRIGLNLMEVRLLLNKFVREGAIPEPLRVAKLIARAALTGLAGALNE
ncbi:MAG: hypothetical protein B6U69_02120 [Thermofilum sp. ex4484_15]|nr:MAG: hypothetical protein B6U69_02120 [Thermofilum sp. ex4484_15]